MFRKKESIWIQLMISPLLREQQWPSDLFYQLSRDQAVRLLNGLRRANQVYLFLQKPAETSDSK